jgi:hypothetical protein
VPAKRQDASRSQQRSRASALPRLGHLLKQAYLQFTGLTSAALEPLGITAVKIVPREHLSPMDYLLAGSEESMTGRANRQE